MLSRKLNPLARLVPCVIIAKINTLMNEIFKVAV